MNTVWIRASSLPDLFDCPARWEAKHIYNRHMPSSGASILGKAVHAGTAIYDTYIMNDEPISIDDAIGAVVDEIYNPKEDIDWDEDSPTKIEPIAIGLYKLYCEKIAPKQNYIAVETTCNNLIISDLGLELSGTLDRIREVESQYGVVDLKSGKTAVKANGTVSVSSHAAQVAVYELLAEKTLGLSMELPAQIIGLQAAKTEKGRRVGIGTIKGARELLLGDEGEEGLLSYASKVIHSGCFYGNPRSMLCNVKYCPNFNQCKWRK